MRILLALAIAIPLHAAAAQAPVTRADSLWDRGDRDGARSAYLAELAAQPDRSRAVFRLAVLTRDFTEASRLFRQYTALEPDDPWGWMALGDLLAGRGQSSGAREAYRRAAALNHEGAAARERAMRLATRPSVEPSISHAGDSDGLSTQRIALQADGHVSDGIRAGVGAASARTADDVSDRTVREVWAQLAIRPDPSLRTTLRAGVMGANAVGGDWSTVSGDARLRWRSQGSRMAVAMRAQRSAVVASPVLIDNRTVRSEVSGMLTVPLGPVVVRGGGRAGRITSTLDRNSRLIGDAAVALPIGPVELSAQYHRLGYDHDNDVGYFAPVRVETAEGGVAMDFESDKVTVSLDLGGGAQRVEEFGGVPGPWRLALRGWAALEAPLHERITVQMELEAYDAPFAASGVQTTDHWKYLAASVGLKWIL